MNSEISTPLPDGADQKITRTDEAHTNVPKPRMSLQRLRNWFAATFSTDEGDEGATPDVTMRVVDPSTGEYVGNETLVGPKTEEDSRYRKAPRRTFKPSVEKSPRK